VISSFDEIKKKNIEYYLFDHSTKSVSFYDISPEKSMFEKIEFSKIEVNPDIVLVAGGIGAINIIVQFEKLNVLIIDCGMALEVMANPALKKKRVFLCSNE
jgi:phosphoribosylanthranilate isomerase